MAQFNKNTYNSYLINNDFEGLADYISTFHPSDRNQRLALEQHIHTLRRYGGIANKLLESQTDPEVKDMMAFSIQASNGVYDGTNYGRTYNAVLNKIGSKDGRVADYMSYTFKSDADYDKFINNSGLSISNTESNGVRHMMSNGQHIVQVNRSALSNGDFFMSLNEGLNSLYDAPVGYGGMFGYNVISPARYGFTTTGYTSNGTPIETTEGFEANQFDAYNKYKTAQNAYQSAVDEAYNKVVPSGLTITGFMCGAQKQLYDYWANGRMDTEEYNRRTKIITDYYENQLKSFHLSNAKYKECYVTTDDKTGNLEQIADDKRGFMTDIIRNAVKEGRCTVVAGSAGGRVGAVITISPEADNEGDSKSGDYAKSYTLFVPGLFTEDARKMVDSDSDAKCQVEIAEHQAFGHDYKLIEGGKLEAFDGDGGAFYTTDTASRYLSPDEVIQMMQRNIMIEGGIQEARNNAEYDDDGIILPGQENLRNKIQQYSTNVFAALSGVDSQEALESAIELPQVQQEIDNIFMIIMRRLGLDRQGNVLTY